MNNKTGIKVRHIQQPQIERRDRSPNIGNRRKIFEKVPAYTNLHEEYNKKNEINNDSPSKKQYELLVQNLKNKTMQLELRDNMIKSLNKQLDEMKRQNKNKDREISRLRLEIEELEKYNAFNKPPQQSFAFKKEPAFRSAIEQELPWGREKPASLGHSFTGGQISMMNLNKTPYDTYKQPKREQEIQILSPFMALSNHREQVAKAQVTEKPAFRDSNFKAKQLQKFNIFGQSQDSPLKSGLSIEHSQQYNFQELEQSDWKGFSRSGFKQ